MTAIASPTRRRCGRRVACRAASAAWIAVATPAWAQTAAPSAPPAVMEPPAGWTPGATPEPVSVPARETQAVVSKPLWEVGAGAALLSFPDYRGSDQRSDYLLPLPYVVYRGEFLRADRDGARAVFVDAGRVEVDLSVSGSPPIRHGDRGARAGMASLPATFEVGPNLNVALWRSAEHRLQLDLRLPLRSAITVQRSPSSLGVLFEPKLNLDAARLAGGWNLGLLAGPLFASRRYNAHYYDVGPADVRADRPAYTAGGGYAGWQALTAVSRRYDRAFVGAFLRYDRIGGAVYDDSPLVRRQATLAFGVGMSWTFATSDARVDVPLDR